MLKYGSFIDTDANKMEVGLIDGALYTKDISTAFVSICEILIYWDNIDFDHNVIWQTSSILQRSSLNQNVEHRSAKKPEWGNKYKWDA